MQDSFMVEFYGYNITACGIAKKIYVKAPFAKKAHTDRNIELSNQKLELITRALNNKYLSFYDSNRYSLYDISFRGNSTEKKVGFSFNDTKDSVYIETKQIFKSFDDYDIDSFCDAIDKIKGNMFSEQPQYNPVFMIGMVIEDINLACIKAYIRFDIEEAQTYIKRSALIERIVETINPEQGAVKYFSDFSMKLEIMGFVFSFVGVDNYKNGSKRFKLYYRFYGEDNFEHLISEIAIILSQLGLHSDIYKYLEKHQSGVWGLAVSTNRFKYIEGVQLYFYP